MAITLVTQHDVTRLKNIESHISKYCVRVQEDRKSFYLKFQVHTWILIVVNWEIVIVSW